MKINWGIKLMILYTAFVAMILTAVIVSSGQKMDLESKDYYAQELAFQSKINATKNANELKDGIVYGINGSTVILSAPLQLLNKGIEGKILFNRPSDASLDRLYNMKFNELGMQEIPEGELEKGAYKLQLSWKSEGKEYYKEAIININD